VTRLSNHTSSKLPNRLAVLMLLVLFALLVFSIRGKSPTLDEQNHIARGLAYLKTGDLRLSQEHPPLINAWQAWPLLLDPAIMLPLDSPSWANAEWYGFADLLVWRVNGDAVRERMVFAARVCTMTLTVLLSALVYRWAKALGGTWTGLLAMTVLVFDPNILAHGRLVTTDMGVTCMSVAAMVALWEALRHTDNALRWAMAGLTAGLALGLAWVAKFSALVLGPVSLPIVLVAYFEQCLRNNKMLNVWPWLARLALLYGAAGVTVWVVYGLQWGPIAPLAGVPGPAPAYFAGIQTIFRRTGGGATAFLLGRLSDHGWWYYFPVALAIKTPLPTLLLLLIAIGLFVWRQIIRSPLRPATCNTRHADLALTPHALLLVPPIVFWAMALTGGFNIGYRHILPSLPFLYIWAVWQVSGYIRHIKNHLLPILPSPFAALYALFLVLYLLLAVRTFPDYLAFFNLLVGGPDNGYKFLVDSNLDWGQDLPGLAQWVKQNDVQRINLSWFGAAYPEAYRFAFHPLPGFWRFGGDPAMYGLNPFAPTPGIYAISASNLQGIKLADPNTYAWFRRREPDAQIGHSILIYRVAGRTPSRAVVLATPMAQLGDAERALLAEGAQVRWLDPAGGVIVPAADEIWYILPDRPGWGEVVRQGSGYVVVRGTPPLHSAVPSAQFGTWVDLGYHRVEITSENRLLTVYAGWTVSESPHRAATSFAHLLDAQGGYVAGWDGLTAPATCWQPGDVIMQTYAISLPVDLKPGSYQIEIGWYDVETVQRWPCLIDGQPAGDRFLIKPIEIRE